MRAKAADCAGNLKGNPMSETSMIEMMHDTLDALPLGVTAKWLANYHFVRQYHYTLAECTTLARVAISSY